jgi:mercuric ion transport protein
MWSSRRRRTLPAGLTGLAGVACAACCMIPLLLASGVLGGAGWAAAGRVMPGIAVASAAVAGLAWWRLARQRHASRCAGDAGCSCDGTSGETAEQECDCAQRDRQYTGTHQDRHLVACRGQLGAGDRSRTFRAAGTTRTAGDHSSQDPPLAGLRLHNTRN